MPDFKTDARWEPNHPDHTCPDINNLISQIEKLRGATADLRAYGDYWKKCAEEYANEYEELDHKTSHLPNEVEELQKQVDQLESKVDDLERQLDERSA